MRKTWVQSLGWEDPLEENMATHSSVVAWVIPWTEEPGGLQSVGSQRVGHNRSDSTHEFSLHTLPRPDEDLKESGLPLAHCSFLSKSAPSPLLVPAWLPQLQVLPPQQLHARQKTRSRVLSVICQEEIFPRRLRILPLTPDWPKVDHMIPLR